MYIFPANCTVKFDRLKGQVYPKPQDFWCLVPLTLAILIFRYVLERYCFMPFGIWLQVKHASKKLVPHNDILETAYKKNYKDVSLLSKKLDMTERQLERWWRLRRSQDKPSEMVKFTEDMSKGSFDLFQLIFGLYTLWDKEWLWDIVKIRDCHVGVTSDIWWYYMISTAFYCSLMLTQFWDVHRKDFCHMVVHHFIAIALLSLSWLANFYRIGSLILVIHATDCTLNFVKSAKKARLRKVLLIPMFVSFNVTWVVTKLIIFPFLILKESTIQAIVCNSPMIQFLTVLLWLLMMLHLMWSWMLYQVVHKAVVSRQTPDDIRSSSSDLEDSDKETKKIM